MTISLSYNHSIFPTHTDTAAAPFGLSYCATTARTIAHAIIKRHCSISSWYQPTGAYSDSTTNPLIPLIMAHCDSARTQDLIDMVTAVSQPVTEIYQQQLGSSRIWTTSSYASTPYSMREDRDPLSRPVELECDTTASLGKSFTGVTRTHDHDKTPTSVRLAPKDGTKMDPARRIWSEMRKNSRSTTKRSLQMTSSRSGSSEEAPDNKPSAGNEEEKRLNKEQARILEQALKNKRSVGADTLRSMVVPLTSIGLGFGRSWGWAPPWW